MTSSDLPSTAHTPPARPPMPGSETGRSSWIDIPRGDLDDWTGRLLTAGAALFQLPYWNEALRTLHFRPRYLCYRHGTREEAYACVLTLGIPGLRLGLIQQGPVAMADAGELGPEVFDALLRWARVRGFVFLRFTHHDQTALDPLIRYHRGVQTESFPLYPDVAESLIVDQPESDNELLMRLQPSARRSLRRASEEGYRIEFFETPDRLAEVWPLFDRLSQRKGFTYRPQSSFATLLRAAAPHGGARMYAAHLESRPVQAILIVRDRSTAHYVIGALEPSALGDRESPSVLLHWHAMRDFARLGATSYDLGTRSGAVHQFKRRFRPVEIDHPPPVTIVINPLIYPLWSKVGIGPLRAMRRQIKRLLRR